MRMKQIILVLCLLVSGVGMVSAQDVLPQETADVQTQESAAVSYTHLRAHETG